jgi:HEPN domain-containing protein
MDEAKRELVQSWLLKASDDLGLARLLVQHDRSYPAAAVYHCQQAAEKALKGFLIFWDQNAPRTHNLVLLIHKVAEVEPCFLTWEEAAARLTPYATQYRYPTAMLIEPDPEQIDEALDDAACIYNQVLSYLPAEVHPAATGLRAG